MVGPPVNVVPTFGLSMGNPSRSLHPGAFASAPSDRQHRTLRRTPGHGPSLLLLLKYNLHRQAGRDALDARHQGRGVKVGFARYPPKVERGLRTRLLSRAFDKPVQRPGSTFGIASERRAHPSPACDMEACGAGRSGEPSVSAALTGFFYFCVSLSGAPPNTGQTCPASVHANSSSLPRSGLAGRSHAPPLPKSSNSPPSR